MPNPKPSASFKPGDPRINRKGRPPKGYSITEMMRSMLESKPELRESIGSAIMDKALEGDVTAMKLVWNYMDGMPPQKSEIDMSGGITINVVKYDDGEEV